jgi:opacity protein-like surface antigen
MRRLLIVAILACAVFPSVAMADQYVNGYMRQNGTYVQPHWRSDANNTRNDNYSTRGNVNPYNGKKGYQPNDYDYNNNDD